MHNETELAEAISKLTCALNASVMERINEFEWYKSHCEFVTKQDLQEMEGRMAIKLSEIKAAVATAKAQNREAFAEIGTKIADLTKQIEDLVAGVGDPTVTDEVFEKDLADLLTDAKALAEIVPGTPTPA